MKMPRITNIWTKVSGNEAGEFFSQVIIESTGHFATVIRQEDGKIILAGSGVVANMPVGAIDVYDGLIGEIYLAQEGPDKIRVVMDSGYPAEFKYEVTGELPVKITISMERSFISKLFHAKKIVIDPGHNKTDTGGCGPVNLVEKNVVLPIAQILGELFKRYGAQVFLTRRKDLAVSPRERWEVVRRCQADLFVSIHTNVSQDSRIGGVAVNYSPEDPASARLAQLVKEGLVKKLKLTDRGIKKVEDLNKMGPVPAIEVEVVTITNWVEEGLLRSPTVHMKAAEGIFNGVKDYLAGQFA